jgi:2-isopropylmalate synthase
MAKYAPFPSVTLPNRQWPTRTLTAAPVWCSVDLRDGNQALIEPMNVEEKLVMFELLVSLGFKEIEVAFPAASEVEFSFVRTLIEQHLIPDDVTIQVLTQSREALIRRTFEAIAGAKHAIVHLYNSTSPAQRRVVFGMSEAEVVNLAVTGTRLIRSLAEGQSATQVRLEYSPESFTSTELPFSLEISEAVHAEWGGPMILNLPTTVEVATPNVYADQIEWMLGRLKNRPEITLSLHTHNDRGGAVASAELGLLAGADRVEGTLFGYGERTGNVDILTVATNLMAHGIDPNLDLHDLPHVVRTMQRCTDEPIHPRHPYVGELVYTAFSGSHQDAINKGLRERETRQDEPWDVPYLLIDPKDIGREYEGIIRVNSQSGKGGVAYVLRLEFGIDLPKEMQPHVSAVIQRLAEQTGREMKPADIWTAFSDTYLESNHPYELISFTTDPVPGDPDHVEGMATARIHGVERTFVGVGNGPLEALRVGLLSIGVPDFEIVAFHQHSVDHGAAARAVAFARVKTEGRSAYGAGLDPNSMIASLRAIFSALNLVNR